MNPENNINPNGSKNDNPKSFKARIQKIWANTRKEMKILWKDRFAMILLILLPITLVLTIYTVELVKGEQ